MQWKETYPGIDCFRLWAALLVVAIHTSPLAMFGSTGDFILTRVAARLAVPFFFMTSGFFLISHYAENANRLVRFVKHTCLIYGLAIVLYLPVNVYNGYFQMEELAPNLVKDLVFDGTVYHLWYLPASVIGAMIAWYLVRRFDYPKAVLITAGLYVVGVFGDSYYGLAEGVWGGESFYRFLFQLSDHTRNGVFFAPVFFVLGGFIADSRREMELFTSARGFGISFALMLGEAMCLRRFGLQRHDSMYLFLLPCAYFLFQMLLHVRGKRRERLRTLSLLVYLLHPMVIVFVRLFAKGLHLQGLLVENSIVHYVAVCLLSVGGSMAVAVVWERYGPHRRDGENGRYRVHEGHRAYERYGLQQGGRRQRRASARGDRTYVEIDLRNLEHNVRELRLVMPSGCRLMAVVKAEAYGHGSFEIATHLEKSGVRAFAVATIDEGIRLRTYGIRGEILILGFTEVSRAAELKKYDLMQTLIDRSYAEELDRQGVRIRAHIKIDTGMHRLGEPAGKTDGVKRMFELEHIDVCGMFTHLSCADRLEEEDVAFTRKQIERFYALVDELRADGVRIPKLHIQSSYGLLNYPELRCDYVRAGIALFGVPSSPGEDTIVHLDLRPVLSLKSKVVLIRSLKKGECVGYGREFIAERDSRIAMVPAGYADGYPRGLSCGKGNVRINDCLAPVIGRVCMDQLAVDITDAGGVEVGDTVVLIGGEMGEGASAPELAGRCGSISNELLSRLGTRVRA